VTGLPQVILSRFGDDIVVRVLRDCAAGSDRGEARSAAAANDAVDLIAMKKRPTPPALCRDTFGEHLDDGIELGAWKLAIRVGPADQLEQIVFAPRFAGRSRNDMLSQHIERPWRNLERIE
jgi:hypothetical protein